MAKALDSGMLQYVPKGAYYEAKDVQFNAVKKMWNELFEYDRVLFALTSILNGTGFSKGAMTHKLLSNPLFTVNGKDLGVPDGIDPGFERKIVMYNLHRLADNQMNRAIKNLLMLAGEELHSKVNNSRTRNVILDFLFNRPSKELDALAVGFKSKLSKLVRHALGKQDLFKILNNDKRLFQKKIGRYNSLAYPVICHLFNKQPKISKEVRGHFPKIDDYWKAKKAAQTGDIKEFKKLIKILPWRVAMGFKNTYKLPIDNSEVLGKGKMSDKEALSLEAAVKKSGAKKRVINYNTQDLYDLWKALYFKISNDDIENVDKISDAIEKQSEKIQKLNVGESCVIILDASHSMIGSDERLMHPFLTGLCVIYAIENVENIFIVGGKWKDIDSIPDKQIVFPANASPLWKGLVEAVTSGAENIVIISDGYENSIKGMFEHVYKHFKDSGYDFNLFHINPVFSADSKSGSSRSLVKDISPMPVGNYKYLETEFIFNQMLENPEVVKQLLIEKYKKLIGGKKT